MKYLLFVLLTLAIVYSSCSDVHSQKSDNVLLFIRDGSGDLEYTLTNEVGVMTEILEQSGFTVVVATISGDTLSTDSVQVIPDLKLSDVDVTEYSGIILPCMHAGTVVDPQAVAMVKEAVLAGKPIASQHASIVTLVKAGVLQGKQYAYHTELDATDYPESTESVYIGKGVVRDGSIITSGVCPYLAELTGFDDCTELLTNSLIDTINAKTM